MKIICLADQERRDSRPLSLYNRVQKGWTSDPEVIRTVLDLYRKYWSTYAIAKKLMTTNTTIFDILQKNMDREEYLKLRDVIQGRDIRRQRGKMKHLFPHSQGVVIRPVEQVWKLHFNQGKSVEEVARIIGIGVEEVNKLVGSIKETMGKK